MARCVLDGSCRRARGSCGAPVGARNVVYSMLSETFLTMGIPHGHSMRAAATRGPRRGRARREPAALGNLLHPPHHATAGNLRMSFACTVPPDAASGKPRGPHPRPLPQRERGVKGQRQTLTFACVRLPFPNATGEGLGASAQLVAQAQRAMIHSKRWGSEQAHYAHSRAVLIPDA
jgi:hypothetical protein